jgi:hypothetical protein
MSNSDGGISQALAVGVHRATGPLLVNEGFANAMKTGEKGSDRLLLWVARKFDKWAQNGPRETYAARRAIGYHLRKSVRETPSLAERMGIQ